MSETSIPSTVPLSCCDCGRMTVFTREALLVPYGTPFKEIHTAADNGTHVEITVDSPNPRCEKCTAIAVDKAMKQWFRELNIIARTTRRRRNG